MAESQGKARSARDRVIEVARAQFIERGYSATSLQMIADALGVTKAAVYHQFPSKAEILHAVVDPAIRQMARIGRDAERAATADDGFEIALGGLVDLVVEHGDIASMIRRDAAVTELLATDGEFAELTGRLDSALIGTHPTPAARAALVVAGGGLMLAGSDPGSSFVDEATLRHVLSESVRRVLEPYRPRA
jgi:AcrR family transcriptional regulator